MQEKLINEVDELVYISMADFSRRIDEIKDMTEKIVFVSEYILSHNNNADWSLPEAINIAKMKIADGIVEYRKMEQRAELVEMSKEDFPEDDIKDVDLDQYGNVLNNNELNRFMNNPASYIRKYGVQKLADLSEKNEGKQFDYYEQLKYDNIMRNMEILKNTTNVDLNNNDKNHVHIKARLEAKYGGQKALRKAYNNIKPGFFSTIFNTTSTEGKNLIAAYKNFNNNSNPAFGQIEPLERAANAYLIHIFPKFKEGYPLPDIHLVNQLSGTQKSRTLLCMNILDSIRKERKIDEENQIDNNEENEFDMDSMSEDNTIQKTNIENLNNDLEESFSDDKSLESDSSNNIINSEEVSIKN